MDEVVFCGMEREKGPWAVKCSCGSSASCDREMDHEEAMEDFFSLGWKVSPQRVWCCPACVARGGIEVLAEDKGQEAEGDPAKDPRAASWEEHDARIKALERRAEETWGIVRGLGEAGAALEGRTEVLEKQAAGQAEVLKTTSVGLLSEIVGELVSMNTALCRMRIEMKEG